MYNFLKMNRLMGCICVCLVISLVISMMCMSAVHATVEREQEFNTGLKEHVDRYMRATMSEQHIAGAVVTVVKDGKTVLNEGYGYADIESDKQVDPDKTLFRIGSVSKVVTAVAALQQVEQGHIQLSEDVNTYLGEGLKISNPYDVPLTVAHLLTNTGGFAEKTEGIYSEVPPKSPKPLADTLKDYLPPMIRPPGEVVQYSNYGFTLLGYLVEERSSESFDQYIDNHIFKPLSMNQTHYRLAPEWLDQASKGYAYEKDRYVPQPQGEVLVYPTGSLISTGEDMSKFLLALLQEGENDGKRILGEQTVRTMFQRNFTVHDSMPGYGYGFYQHYRNPDIYLHNGDIDHFTSRLSLSPKHQLGFFVSYNSADDGILREGLEEVIYSYYGISLRDAENLSLGNSLNVEREDLSRYNGTYVFAQRVLEGPLKIRGLFLKVKINAEQAGRVKVQAFDPVVSGEYIQAGKHLYVNKENGRMLYFKEDRSGQQYAVINMDVPLQTLEKLTPYEVFMESYVRLLVFGMAVIGLLVQFVLRIVRRRRGRKTYGSVRKLTVISGLINLLILSLGVSILLVMFTVSDHFRAGVLWGIWGISAVIFGLVLGIVFYGVRLWKQGQLNRWYIGYFILIIFESIGAIAYAQFLNLYFV